MFVLQKLMWIIFYRYVNNFKFIINLIMKTTKILFIFLITGICLFAKPNLPNNKIKNRTLVNTSHLDNLYQKIEIDGKQMGIIHIYANYPEYKYVDAPGEGIACVDDAARAAIFYMNYYEIKHNSVYLNKVEMLTKFMLYMQSDNGFFYNFISSDFKINKTYKTSVAEPNWWSWRAIWELSEAYNFFLKYDKSFASEIYPLLNKSMIATIHWLQQNKPDTLQNFGGFNIPSWLPYGNASDQAAVIIKGFLDYNKSVRDSVVRNEIIRLCKGIEKMQAGDSSTLPYYAFLSWENKWHLWGNNQAEALIDAGKRLKNQNFIKAAQNEVLNFYPYLIKYNYMSNFTVIHKNNKSIFADSLKYGQIAYGISPMVLASCKLYNVDKNIQSAKIAGLLGCWFFGENPTGKQIYNIKTGVCYDGINNANEINMNSGAESTIEALFAMLAIEQNPIAKQIVWNYYDKHILKH